MFKRLSSVIVLALATTGVGRADISLSDLQVVVGTGSNEAGFVVDWKDASGADHSLAWGYRWDGSATGEDMLRALAASPETGLNATLGYFTGLGYAVLGIGVDLDPSCPLGLTPPLSFPNGIATGDRTDLLSPGETRSATGNGYYEEGWYQNGYWSYWTKDSSSGAWGYSPVGISSSTLTNGSWQGWSFALNFAGGAPASPTPAEPRTTVMPAPEPSGYVLMLTSGPALLFVLRRGVRLRPAA